MATKLTYNGVEMFDVHTQAITNDIQTDRTGVDPIFNRVKVSVRCLVKRYNVSSGDPRVEKGVHIDGIFATGLDETLRKLSMPRRDFLMEINGATLFDVKPARTEKKSKTKATYKQMDVDNGPKPKVNVIRVTGNDSAYIEFELEMAIVVCDGDTPKSPTGDLVSIINLRWWYASDIDGETFLSTRQYEGTLRLADNSVNPQLYRDLVIPPLPQGFRRRSITVSDDPDGMGAQFIVIDEETYRSAPGPATSWHGFHSIMFPQATRVQEQFVVNLTGPRGVDQRKMSTLGWQIVNAKTSFIDDSALTGQGKGTVFVTSANQTAGLEKNTMSTEVHIQHTGRGGTEITGANFFELVGDTFGKELVLSGYDYNVSQNPGPSDLLIGLLRTPNAQNPCFPDSIKDATLAGPLLPGQGGGSGGQSGGQGGQSGQGTGSSTPGTVIQRSDGDPLIKTQPLNFSDEHYRFAYSVYNITSKMHINNGRVALPRGVARGQGSGLETMFVGSLHEAVAIREVTINAQRLNEQPVLPKNEPFRDSNGIVHTPLHYIPAHASGRISFDGRKVLYDSGIKIVYALSRPPTAQDTIPIGDPPYHQKEAKPFETGFLPKYLVDPKSLLE